MKISSITITNFKGIGNVTLSPDHINVFLGKNGSGKSAALSAITFILTGKVNPEFIKSGEEVLSVSMEFEDGTVIERSRSIKDGTVTRCNGKKTSGKSANVFLKEKLGADAETYEALCGIDYLKSLSSKELSALFLSILPAKVSFQKFLELAAPIIKNEFFCDLEKQDIKYLKDILEKANTFGIEEMESAYKKAFNDRRELKPLVHNLIARSEFVESTLPKETEEELHAQIEKIAKTEADLENYKKQIKLYENSVQKHDEAVKKKQELIQSLNVYANVQKPDESVKTQAEDDKLKFQNAIKKSQNYVATADANIRLFERTLDSLDKPICPISNKLVCTTDKTGLKEELKDLLAQNQKVKQEHQNFLKRCEKQILKRDAILKKYQEYLVLFTKKSGIEQQIRDFVIPEILPKPKEIPVTDFQAQKGDARRKLSIREAHKVALKARNEFEEKNRMLKTLEMAVRILDVKTGVPAIVLKAALTKFENAANQKASQIHSGFELSISCDSGFAIKVKTGTGKDFLPLDVVSTGEYLLVAFLLMDIINQITDARYLVIDNLDALDEEHTKVFLDMLDKDSSYEHIFIGAVNHDDTKRAVSKYRVYEL